MSDTIEVKGTVADGSGANPGGGEERRPLSLWPGMYHSPVTAALWQARANIFEKAIDGDHDGPAQMTLMSKSPAGSRTSILYPFSSDKVLQEQYRSPSNSLRIGKVLEDLDALAGTIAVRHCSDEDMSTRPLLVVTAAVDKISLKKELSLESDLMLSGVVAWTGRSSMEIRMTVIQPVGGRKEEEVALTANFTFVARDSKTREAAPVNHLVPQTEAEKELFAVCEAKVARLKKARQMQLQEGGVGEADKRRKEDAERLDALLSEGRVLCEMPALADRNSILVRDTRLENTIICQPQQRNLHGRIFGGYLMRCAFELAFSACYVFVGRKPRFQEVDRVDFHRPVDVGDLLRFKSCVLYTEVSDKERPRIHVEVVAFVTQPEVKTSLISNTFYFTFSSELDDQVLVRRVLPASTEEARRILQRYDADHPVDEVTRIV